jgi:hypothetical protein
MTISHDNIDWWKKNMSVSSDIKNNNFNAIADAFGEALNKVEGKRVFESGSQRDSDTNKPLTTALTAYARLRYGYHLRKGSNNYGKDNWKLGQPSEALLESLDRHLAQYLSGDRSEDHLSAIMFGVVMLMQNEEKEGIPVDNYFKKS